MNTKSIIGIVIVVVIIGLIVVWLRKAPATPAAPENPVANAPQTVATMPDTDPSTSSGQAPANAPAASAPAAASQGKIISTSMKGDMKIEVTKEGSGTPITNGQTAVMLYTGTLADGTVFDSTDKHGGQPFSFSLGAVQVIKGWDQGIVGMKVGEERTLIIPADMAYGAAGYPPVIPQNATLTFHVTLVGIK